MRTSGKIIWLSTIGRWFIITTPILLLLPIGFLVYLAWELQNAVPPGLRSSNSYAYHWPFHYLAPLILIGAPLITLLSLAFVYESSRDWAKRQRRGQSLTVAALWMGPAIIYGITSFWFVIFLFP